MVSTAGQRPASRDDGRPRPPGAANGHSDLSQRGFPPLADSRLRPRQPVVILAGGLGSGKTELAINLCLRLRATGDRVRIADLDIVKPFNRCREARELLADAGVELIAPPGEQFFSDLPVILPEIRGMIREAGAGEPEEMTAEPGAGIVVLDVGGDAAGARVLASLAGAFRPDGYEFLLVLNTSRPFTTDLAGLSKMCDEVRAAAGLVPTGLIANTHLMDETDVETVLGGYRAVSELARTAGLPVRMVACDERLAPALPPSSFDCPVLALTRVLGLPETRGARKSPLTYV
ncbi:MAG: cobalamin biosynthesis protein CbiA [Candidatus Wallbacteria bacterium]|nr:cobalamin biosynthesis protein CbiA [Candidatus Wallbacteria bacterium]